MARTALTGRAMGRGAVAGARYIPAASVVAASALAILPIMSLTGWWPNFGLLMLLAWRLLRADCWPAWWAAPLGLANDLIVGSPIGLSVALWPAIMLAMDLVDRRTQFRDYWIEWGVAALLLAFAEWAEWKIAALGGAPLAALALVAPVFVSILAFPLFGLVAGRIDRWRLGR